MDRRELLVIDDEDSIHQVLGRYLREIGITPYSAMDGKQGLEILAAHPDVQVVLTDMRIPGMDGLSILREIKRRDLDTQVILMTAFSDKNLAIQALRLGADDYLEKPFRLDDLGQILERSFNRIRIRSFSSRWQRFLEHLPLGFVRCHPSGVVEGLTPGAQAMMGCASSEAIGRPLWENEGMEAVRSLFATSSAPSLTVEMNICGRWLALQRMEGPQELDSSFVYVVVTDLTQQRMLQRELSAMTADFEEKVEERTRSLSSEVEFTQRLLDTAGVVITYLDYGGHLVRLNKFAEELTGLIPLEAEQLFARLASDSSSPLSLIFDPRSTDEISGMIAEIPDAAGHQRILSWSTRHMPGRSGKGGKLIIGIDVTEQKQLEATLHNYNLHLEDMVEARSFELQQKEAQLIHTARLASLGEIAAGITHEMKQPLNVISITADLIRLLHRNGTLSSEVLTANLEKIRATVDRMATTINHLSGFTRIDSANFRPVRVDEAVDGALAIVGEQIRLDNIDIVRDVPAGLPSFSGELRQIEQVLVNLLQNARDAIQEKAARVLAGGDGPDGKKLTLRAGCVSDGRFVFIDVMDSGTGIPQLLKQRLFEPFFTTKEVVKGTGLGLSISWNIVQSHGGSIEVESEEGRGSTFRVLLPVSTDA